jgi:hypothetical protein
MFGLKATARSEIILEKTMTMYSSPHRESVTAKCSRTKEYKVRVSVTGICPFNPDILTDEEFLSFAL